MIKIVTDPHEGLKRASHTTPASRLRWANLIHEHLMDQTKGPESVYCLGDLFDRSNNQEATIIKGYEAVTHMSRVLSGNHDLINRGDVVTSMQLLHDELGLSDRISFSPFGDNIVDCWEEEGWTFLSVPHCSTQTLFQAALQTAYDMAEENNRERNILLLHCNYDIPVQFCEETSLNLTREDAKDLAEKFRHVVLGHEHNPRESEDGCIVVLGSTMPTDFSCLGEKRAMLLSPEGEISYETIWGRELQAEVKASEILISSPEDYEGLRFLHITGELSQADVSQFNKRVRSLWDSKDILAIRANPSIEGASLKKYAGEKGITNLPEKIAEDLKSQQDQRLYSMFQDVYNEIRKGDPS